MSVGYVAALLLLFVVFATVKADDRVITLAWDPAPGTVNGYSLHMGVSPDQLNAIIKLGNQTSVQVFINHPATFFAVSAYNDCCESDLSNVTSYFLP